MGSIKKGVILAGGSGTRLYPLTTSVNKHLSPVYDKPMIYYPLCTLMEAGLRELCVVGSPADVKAYAGLLGDGGQWGVSISYSAQERPLGIAHALLSAEEFAEGGPVAVILGDNFFQGEFGLSRQIENFSRGATIFVKKVSDARRFGVVNFDEYGNPVSLEEKPSREGHGSAITGLYLFDEELFGICKTIPKSQRGEYEITSVNCSYLDEGRLSIARLGEKVFWLDMGTPRSVGDASDCVRKTEIIFGERIGCPEAVALQKGFIDLESYAALVGKMPCCDYRLGLESLALRYAS